MSSTTGQVSFNNFTFNPPAKAHEISSHGSKVTITAVPETDWWRIPGPDAVDSRTGTFFAIPVDSSRNFEASVWIRGAWGTLFDQGTLMLLTGSGGNELGGNWIKTGVEMEDGKEWIGGVVTNPWSDWAIAPAEKSTSTLVPGSYAVFVKLVREGPLVTIYHKFQHKISNASPTDGLTKMREVRAFNLDSAGDNWRIGVMVCGPKNLQGTVAEFSNFSLRYL